MFSKKVKVNFDFDFSKKTESGNIDVEVSKDFNDDFQVNRYGFPLDPISALNGAKSIQEYNYLLSRLTEYAANNPDNSKKTVAQLIDEVCPRSFQTPSEILTFADWTAGRWAHAYNDAVAAKAEAEAAAAAAGKSSSGTVVNASPE